MERLTAKEKEEALLRFREKQQKLLSRGRAIVLAIAGINIALSVAGAFYRFNILLLLLEITLSAALIFGVTWVRFFFAAVYGIIAFSYVYLLFTNLDGTLVPLDNTTVPFAAIALISFIIIYASVCSVTLFKSKSVAEYLYKQKNG